MLRRIGRLLFKLLPLWSWRLVYYGSAAALVLTGATILGLRYWLLPNIENYRGDLEAALSKATGQRIVIGHISGDWQGWRPQIVAAEVTVFDRRGRAALTLSRIDQTLSWLSLLFLEPRYYSLTIQQPELAVRRAADGTISVAGIELSATEDGGGGLSDWLLRQRELIVQRAAISWIDEQLGAPELRLRDVTFRLYNDFNRHRFGLRALAPDHLAGPVDIRGDFQGGSVRRMREWEGRVFAQLDYANLAAWKLWIPMPISVDHGTGALRMWLEVADNRVTGFTADVRVAQFEAQLGTDLKPLSLASLTGRIVWRGWNQGFEVTTKQLSAVTEDGHALLPMDLTLRSNHAYGDKPASGELRANTLELAPLVQIAEQLPFKTELRAALQRYAPRGTVQGVALKWTGDWPPVKYAVKASFSQLAVNATDSTPGIGNVSGSLDANEERGTLKLANQGTHIELNKVFSQPLVFDTMDGDVSWVKRKTGYDIRLTKVSFANADLAGTLQGGFQTADGARGIADLSGALTRADARQVVRYIPLVVGRAAREWLARSLIAGHSNDIKFRLKGDLADFPFDRGRAGVFEVTARVTGGVLDYAEDWPKLENISADVTFVGNRMEIRSPAASILGTQLTRISAQIADLKRTDEILEISGDAEGPSAEFLRFVAQSPVSAMIDRFTEGMEAQGRGQLALKLTLPLRALNDSRVAGSYQFVNNRLRVDSELPALEQVSGRLEFTERAVRGAGIAAQIFGGAASINVATEGGAVVVGATGRANLDQLRSGGVPLWQALSGSADWRSSINVRAKLADFVIESNLQGVASTLPAPFSKSADEIVPLRLERHSKGGEQDQLAMSWGTLVNATVSRRRDGQNMAIEWVGVGLGTDPPVAEGRGIWVRGALSTLDVDGWRSLLLGPGALESAMPPLSAVDLKVGTMNWFGRRLNDVAVKGRSQAGRWQAHVTARELAGELIWQGAGKGQLTARLERFALPPALERVGSPTKEPVGEPSDYPALDVVVEDFQYKGRALGRLELVAVPAARDWRIERLKLRNADGQLEAEGYWQWQGRTPRTQLTIQLDANDVGKLLARMGYPEGIRSGNARLNGSLSWLGVPQDIDFPSLAGQLMIEAGRGQFVKLDQGAGKLLSILSLQALPRRVALDFKDVFSGGFAFDEIAGSLKIQSGVGVTDGFRINGSSAKVSMSGEVDFAKETQKLRVRVIPSLGDSVATVTALLGGPVAGIGVFLAQKLLNDPLGQLIAYDYAVSGTWSDPQVTKIAIERPALEPG